MNNRNMHRAALRFPRTLGNVSVSEARYAVPFEHHLPSRRHMLANPWFWRAMALSIVLWCLAAWAVWSVL